MTNFQKDLEVVSKIDAVPNILEVVCRSTGMGFAAVARVTRDRWIACAVCDQIEFGLKPGGELPVETTICDEIRENGKLIVIDRVSEDDAFCNHPTPRMYGFQSYISVPIFLKDGSFFGTLCAIDPKPARLNTPETIGMFNLFAELIAFHLDAHDRIERSEILLTDERQTAALREQFIAVLGHDLRNPLNAIRSGVEVLLRQPLDERALTVASTLKKSGLRMAELINNLMDLAHGRLGGGIPVRMVVEPKLQEVLEHTVEEVRMTLPGRSIDCELELTRPVRCDAPRISQMLSNLLTNALNHGDPNEPVSVKVGSDEGGFELSVTNAGDPISPDDLSRLFQPFERSVSTNSREGLGLGLYIASEIARAHEGSLKVSSSSEETRFTFTMPASDGAAPLEAYEPKQTQNAGVNHNPRT